LTRCCARDSIHSGWIFAAVRAYSFVVCTISAAMIHFGPFLNSPDPGKMLNFVERAPLYSKFSARVPMFESRPARSARWMVSLSAGTAFSWNPMSASCAWSCWWTSSHSRIRVYDRKFCWHSFRILLCDRCADCSW
jgi:hypothetical protein